MKVLGHVCTLSPENACSNTLHLKMCHLHFKKKTFCPLLPPTTSSQLLGPAKVKTMASLLPKEEEWTSCPLNKFESLATSSTFSYIGNKAGWCFPRKRRKRSNRRRRCSSNQGLTTGERELWSFLDQQWRAGSHLCGAWERVRVRLMEK